MSDATDRPAPSAITWQCPYCREATSESEQGIRTHINNRDDDIHEGISGWNLGHHVPGYNRDGHLVAAIPASAEDFDGQAIVPASVIRNTDWHHEFVHPQQALPEKTTTEASTDEPASSSPDPSQQASDEDLSVPDEIEIPVAVLDEIQTILSHYREAGKRQERLAEPGSIPAARAQARWYTAGRFIEMFDTLYEDTEQRPAQAGHDRQL